ncbi:MAG: response regulator [Synechococcales bacterium]|nr:response regulator [Synechococcales bacterium]
MKILIVEDDRIIASTLDSLLKSYNYAVDIATDGEAGLQRAETQEYDLILLDSLLPKLDGIRLCQELRAKQRQMPILLLMEQDPVQQNAAELNARADDYVIKPFDLQELMVRVQNLLRREHSPQPILTWGALSLNPTHRVVTYGTNLLNLTAKAYATLELFLSSPQVTFNSTAIIEHVWNRVASPGDEGVRSHIKEIRQKLTTAGAPKNFIKTVRRAGYCLNPLYSSTLAQQTQQQPTAAQIAELTALNAELRSTQAAFHQKHQELERAYQTIAQTQQQLQIANNELEQRVAERTAAHNMNSIGMNSIGLWEWEITTGHVFWNANHYQVLGYQPGEIEPSYQTWRDRVHPNDIESVEQKLSHALETHADYEAEFRILLEDGNIRWLHSQGQGVYDEAGHLVRMVGVEVDITDRKQTEAALQASEAKYRSLFNSVDEGFHIIELIDDEAGEVVDYRFLESNPAFERLTGLQNAAGKLGSEIAPQTESYWLEAYDQVARTGEPLRIENYNEDTQRWYSAYASRVGGADSRQVAIIFDDISERKRVEAALRESEAQYRSLFNSIDEGFCMIERLPGEPIDFRYLEANPAFAVQTGISDVVGKTLRQVLSDVPEAVCEIYENVLNTGEPLRFEIDVPSINRILELYAFRIDGASRLAIIFKDITERKRTEAQQAFLLKFSDALRAEPDADAVANRAIRMLFEQMQLDRCYIAVYRLADDRADFTHQVGNDRVPPLPDGIRLSDFPEALRVAFDRTLVIHDIAETEGLLDIDRQSIESLGLRALVAATLRRGENNPLWAIVSVSAHPRQWTRGEIALVEEVTERTWAAMERARAEAALREAEIQQVREQSEREQERQRAEALTELDRAKTQFFSNISHEFRTPLTLILGFLTEALEALDGEQETARSGNRQRNDLSLRLKEQLQTAQRNGLRLLKLVNTLLDFSRIEADRLQAHYQPTDLAAYTAELASMFRSTLEHAQLQLVLDCPPLPEPVYVDREMWEKIVLNLLSNAFKFTFTGEIRVRLYPDPPNRKSKIQSPKSVMLEIHDTGIGIPAADQPHLFERFYQVKGTRGRSYEGSGIGLALVQELVKLHGGTIAVTSTVGQGSCFRVTIPTGKDHLPVDQVQDSASPVPSASQAHSQAQAFVEEIRSWQPETATDLPILDERSQPIAQPSESNRPQPPSEHPEATPRILVVDDNADMQRYLQRILNPVYRVDTVPNGLVALDAIAQHPPDLVVSDVMMPEMDGLQLLQSLRNNAQTQDIPIILLSARAGEAAQIEGLTSGADDYLIKPFSARELLARIETNLKLSRMRREVATQAAEMQIMQTLNDRLEQRVAERTVQLQDLNQELEAFAHAVSHDLKTPLHYIISFAQQLRPLLDSNAANIATSRSSTLDIILRSATAAEQLVDHLLEFSRTGQIEMRMMRVSMQALVQQVQTQLQAQLEGRTVHWQVAPLPSVMGDPTLLQLVWQNLLANAVKYTRDRPIAEITISCNETETEIIFSVQDNGAGFEMKYVERLFGLFQRLHPQEAFAGSGVGLANVRRIIHRHGGRTWAEGEVERGAIFYFSLPQREEAL